MVSAASSDPAGPVETRFSRCGRPSGQSFATTVIGMNPGTTTYSALRPARSQRKRRDSKTAQTGRTTRCDGNGSWVSPAGARTSIGPGRSKSPSRASGRRFRGEPDVLGQWAVAAAIPGEVRVRRSGTTQVGDAAG